MKDLFRRVWESPTANTWLSLFTRSVSLVLVLPLVLGRFSDTEAAVWFVFSSVLAVQAALGFGFSPSFSRLLAYARAGAEIERMADLRENRTISGQTGENRESLERLLACMRRVFRSIAGISLVLMASVGTAAVWRPIAAAGHGWPLWTAWAVVAVVASASFIITYYVSVLQGMNRLTEWRRWETSLSLASIGTAFVVLLAGGRVLALTLVYQGWAVVGLVVYRRLCLETHRALFDAAAVRKPEPAVFRLVWDSAWKSGLTSILTYGLIQSTGVIQAQFGSPAQTTTYNLMLRLATMIGQVVQAPFLSKLPELARLRALGDLDAQRRLLARGMRLTHWTTVAATAAVALGMPFGLKLIRSQSAVFDPILWLIFSTNLFFERHGGMLHHIRNLTNRPMEHVGMFGYFGVNVALMLLLHQRFGIYAYPLAMLGAQLLFALWFNAAIAYHVIEVNVFRFERTISIPPLLAQLAVNCGLVWWLRRG
jgi:O-antigen/teichoic acid export membrane protein